MPRTSLGFVGNLHYVPMKPTRNLGKRRLRRIVMGQRAISVDQTVATLCRWRGVRRTPGVPMWPWLIQALIRILPIEINDWDRFSIRQRHFIHSPASTPERFGGTSHAPEPGNSSYRFRASQSRETENES